MLYVVATPIGNLGDISARALEVLESCDLIAAEDTRHTQKLLSHFNIRKPLLSYYEHNKVSRGPMLLEKLRNGETIALVSDAGTPGISDPGADIIKTASEEGLEVSMVPGPVAGIMALVLSGLPTDKFVFEGFIGTDNKNKKAFSKMLASERRTVVIYEAPHRLLKTLELLEEVLKDTVSATGSERRIAVCRELTKAHEEILRGTAGEIKKHFTENEPRGEFVLVIEGAGEQNESHEEISADDIYLRTDRKLRESELSGNKLTRNEALKIAASELGIPRNKAYALYEEAKAARNKR